MSEEGRKPGPWSIGKSIVSGEPQTTNLPEPEETELKDLTEQELKDKQGFLGVSDLAFVQTELAGLADLQKLPDSEVSDFTSKSGYALSLGLKEKEIFFFGLMQWVAVGIGYLLWVQMLFWIPDAVWEAAANDEDLAWIPNLILFAWSFLCVGVAAFPIGIFSSCMGVTHFLHKQGRESTIAMCLKLSLPNAYSLWSFHWTDGWITVMQILSRLPNDEDKRTLAQKAADEALYYAWKVGIAGVLPSLVLGKGMIESGKESVAFVKQNTKEIIRLRSAYSGICWVIGILTYVLAFFVIVYFGSNEFNIANFYLLMAAPIVLAVGVIMFFLRPIYVLSMCNLYSDYLTVNNKTVDLPDNPPRAVSALVVFSLLCVALLVIFYFREEIGLIELLSRV